MSTFERAHKRIIHDINSTQNLDSVAWANIMLKHTSQLTDSDEQQKFWNWMTNPTDCDLDKTTKFVDMPVASDPEPFVTAEENDETIELENKWVQNGLCTYIKTVPKRGTRTLGRLQLDHSSLDEEDEKVAI